MSNNWSNRDEAVGKSKAVVALVGALVVISLILLAIVTTQSWLKSKVEPDQAIPVMTNGK